MKFNNQVHDYQHLAATYSCDSYGSSKSAQFYTPLLKFGLVFVQ